jgi:hypothetical protein
VKFPCHFAFIDVRSLDVLSNLWSRALPDFDSPYGPLEADEDMVIGDLIAKKMDMP